MNKIILMGRLTREPDIRWTKRSETEDAVVAKFSLAVDRKFKSNNDSAPTADFFNCVAFGTKGEFVDKYLKKGMKILITGRVQNDNYTNREGEKVYSITIIVDEIYFAESKAAQERAMNAMDTSERVSGNPDGLLEVPEDLEDELPFN